MVETTNNIIYWSGYALIFGLVLLGLILTWWKIFEKLAKTKDYFFFITNFYVDKRMKNMTDEEFQEFQDQLVKKYKKSTHGK